MARFRYASTIVFLLLSLPNIVQAQQDENPGQILESNVDDTAKISRLLTMVELYYQADPELAMKYCDALYRLSDSLNITTAIIDASLYKSKMFFYRGEMDSAKIICRNAILLSDSIQDEIRLADLTYFDAVLLYVTEGPLAAIDLFRVSFGYYSRISDSTGMSNALNGIGVAFYEQSKYDSAVYYLLNAELIAELNGYTAELGKVLINLGLVYDNMDENDMAINCFQRSIKYNEENNNMINVAKAIHNTGNIYVQERDLDSAWFMYNKGLEMNLEMNHPEGIANSYIGLGDVSDLLGNYSKAHDCFKKAKYYYGLIGHKQGLLISYKNLGMNEWRRKNYSKALEIYDSSLIIARELGLLQRELEIYGNICDTYVSSGDYLNAYKAMVIRFNLNDSIMDIEKREKIAHLELSYEKEKKNAQILALKNENIAKELQLETRTRQRNTYLFSGTGIIALVIFFFTYNSQRNRKNRIIAEQRIKQLEEEKKLLAARSIVEGQEEERKRIAKELHDGLGVLLSSAKMHFTSIRDQSPEARPMIDKATKLLEQASGDVRKISHNMMPGLLSKFGLFEAVEDLFEQVDEMEGLNAKVTIDGEQTRVKENTEIMLYRVIQEMVNNTLKHAEAEKIDMHIIVTANKLEIVYQDDGKGYDPKEVKAAQSMGLQSINSRVSYLGGACKLKSAPGKGVRYDIEVPV